MSDAPPSPDGDATRRDGPVPPTRRGGGTAVPPTRRGGTGQGGDGELPPELAVRFEVIGPLSGGGEAEVFHARATDGTEVVVKCYFRGIEVDSELYEVLTAADDEHVIKVREWGRVDGRCYEVLDYVPGGTLEGLLDADGPTFTTAEVTVVVAELLSALRHLSAVAGQRGRRFVHRDLKPANVFIRSRQPLDLVLGDFGASLLTERSRTYIDPVLTYQYAAPEVVTGGHTHDTKSDLWNVGIIAYQMSTGIHPLSGLDTYGAITYKVSIEGLDVDEVADRRVRLLCQGLLAIKEDDRWGYDEVQAWLGGESPPVALPTAPADQQGFEFGGATYTRPAALALAMAADWSRAADQLAGPTGRAALEGWLGGHTNVEAVRRVLDAWAVGGAPSPDRRLALMVALLVPDTAELPFRRWRVDGDHLRGLARRAADGSEPERDAVASLFANQILPVYAETSAGTGLAVVDERWRSIHDQYRALSRQVSTSSPGPPPTAEVEGLALARHLSAALDPRAADALVTSARRLAAETASEASPWFGELADALEGSGAVAASSVVEELARVAADQAAQAAQEAAARRAEEERRHGAELDRERTRLAGRDRRTLVRLALTLVTAVVPLALGLLVVVVSCGAIGHFPEKQPWPDAFRGLQPLDAVKLCFVLGAAVVAVLFGLVLLGRRRFSLRPLAAMVGAGLVLVGAGVLINREGFLDDTAAVAARVRVTTPIPNSEVADLCRGRTWTGATRRTMVVGEKCDNIRQYQAWVPQWEVTLPGMIDDLAHYAGGVYVALSRQAEQVIGVDGASGAVLWSMPCRWPSLSAPLDEGSQPTRVAGRCDSVPFDVDPTTGA